MLFTHTGMLHKNKVNEVNLNVLTADWGILLDDKLLFWKNLYHRNIAPKITIMKIKERIYARAIPDF